MPEQHTKSNKRPIPLWLWITCGAALLLTIGLAFDLSPWLRGDRDFRWMIRPEIDLTRLPLTAITVMAYIGGAAFLWRWGDTDRRAWWVVGFAAAASIVIQVVALTIFVDDPLRELIWRTTAGNNLQGAAGWFDILVFQFEDVNVLLRNFPQEVSSFHPHAQRHPPGLFVYYALIKRFMEHSPGVVNRVMDILQPYRCEHHWHIYLADATYATAIGGLLTVPLNAAAAFPLYDVGRKLIGRKAALGAVLISTLIPGYVIWAAGWDAAFVLVTALLTWLLYAALIERRHWAWWLAGLLLSLATFVQYSALTLIGFAGFYTLIHLWLDRNYWLAHWQQLTVNGVGFLITLSSIWVIYWLVYGVTFFEVWQANTNPHFEMTTHYGTRLFYNPYDFFLFLGYVLGGIALAALWQAGRSVIVNRGIKDNRTAFVIAASLTLTALTLSGISRAEVGRVWMLLMPLALLTAFAAQDGPAHSTGRWIGVAVILALQTIVMQTVLDHSQPPAPILEHVYDLDAEAVEAGVQLGDSIRLVGYHIDTMQVQPGGTLNLTLYWQTNQRQTGDLVSFAHIFAPEAGLIAQRDDPPLADDYPMHCWLPGEVVAQPITVDIPPDAMPGNYELLAGMYTWPDLTRLPVSSPGAQADQITLGEVEVVPAK
jgi:hypothetical protein